MRVYSIWGHNDDEHGEYFSTKRKAMRRAREIKEYAESLENYEGQRDIEVEMSITSPDLTLAELMAAMLNRDGWCTESKVVATLKIKERNDGI